MGDAPPASSGLHRAGSVGRSGKGVRLWAVVLASVTLVWTATMLASLHGRFLDRLLAPWDVFASDFFQTPRGFLNLLAGNNIFLTELSDYGPYATLYFNHPLLALAVGLGPRPCPPGRPSARLPARWSACWLSVLGRWPPPSTIRRTRHLHTSPCSAADRATPCCGTGRWKSLSSWQ